MINYLQEKVDMGENVVVTGLPQIMSAREFMRLYLANNSKPIGFDEDDNAMIEIDGNFVVVQDL